MWNPRRRKTNNSCFVTCQFCTLGLWILNAKSPVALPSFKYDYILQWSNLYSLHSRLESLYWGLFATLCIKDTSLLKTPVLFPQQYFTVLLNLWIKDTSKYRTASGVQIVSVIKRFYCISMGQPFWFGSNPI